MTSYINKFDKNTITMSLKVKDKKLKYGKKIKYVKKKEKLMDIDFNAKPIYGDDDDKCIKTKIKTYKFLQ